jgi:DNA primase
MEKYELQKLRDLPIEGVAERLGLRVVRHKCLCPFHDDHHASLSFKVSKNMFRCFVCGASGGTIDLVMKALRKDFKEACQWLGGADFRVLKDFKDSKDLKVKAPPLFDASRYSRFFERPWLIEEARKFLFEERRLDPRVVRWCRLTSWRDKQGISWLQIPYYNREGQLIGIQNRNLGKSPSGDLGGLPRFRFPSGSQCSIYNLPVLNLLRPGDELYITEGCSDCWAMLSAGHKAIAIPSATLLSQKDIEILSTLNSQLSTEFHMYPDNDTPGERLFLQLKEVLPLLVHHQLPQGCKDFSEYYLKLKTE